MLYPGVSSKGDKIRSGYLSPAFPGAHMGAEVLDNPCGLGGPHQKRQNQKWLPHPCLLMNPH